MKKLLLLATILLCQAPALAYEEGPTGYGPRGETYVFTPHIKHLAQQNYYPQHTSYHAHTTIDVCTSNREVYIPGYRDNHGNYVPGGVRTESYNVPCGSTQQGYERYRSPRSYPREKVCDPSKTLLGATLGGGVGAVLSRGEGRLWAVPLGAFVGGHAFGCK